MINIYAPNHYKEKEQCLAIIKEVLKETQDGKIILGGDLNLVRSIEEKFGGNFHVDPSRSSLEEIMDQQSLLDIPPNNGKYTWNNKRVGKSDIKERLDRIMIQDNIAALYNSIKSKIIHTTTSDHKLVVIAMGKMENQGPLPFRYNSVWDSSTEINELVKEAWALRISGSPQYIWETKLKNLRSKLKEWARAKKKEKELQQKMDSLQAKKESKEESRQDYLKEKEIFWEIYRENRKEEEEARLKSRNLWLKAGDKNRTFFHNSMKVKRARNEIEKIQVDNQEIKGVEEIKKATHKHFKNLLVATEEMAEYEEILQHTKKKIKKEQNKDMCKDLTEEEIVEAI